MRCMMQEEIQRKLFVSRRVQKKKQCRILRVIKAYVPIQLEQLNMQQKYIRYVSLRVIGYSRV